MALDLSSDAFRLKVAAGLTGIYGLVKDASEITDGASLYWDADGNPYGGTAGSGCLTTTATDNTFVGFGMAAQIGSVQEIGSPGLFSHAT